MLLMFLVVMLYNNIHIFIPGLKIFCWHHCCGGVGNRLGLTPGSRQLLALGLEVGNLNKTKQTILILTFS